MSDGDECCGDKENSEQSPINDEDFNLSDPHFPHL